MSTRDENVKALRSVMKSVSESQYDKYRHGYLCPRCKEPMVERTNGRTGEPFFGCSQYPDCEGTRDENGECDEEIGVSGYDEDDYDYPQLRDWGDL